MKLDAADPLFTRWAALALELLGLPWKHQRLFISCQRIGSAGVAQRRNSGGPHGCNGGCYPNNGFTFFENARSIVSLSNSDPPLSTNSHRYSCRNHRSPIAAFSSSRNSPGILEHSVAGTLNRAHRPPPFDHSS